MEGEGVRLHQPRSPTQDTVPIHDFPSIKGLALETLSKGGIPGRKGNRSSKPISSISGGSELASRRWFLKRQRVQLRGLVVTLWAPHLMRNHFIAPAPGGHQFSAVNQAISGKFQRLEKIISVIIEPFRASPRLPADPAQRLPAHCPSWLPLFTRAYGAFRSANDNSGH